MKIEGGVGAAVSPLIDFETDCNLQLLLLSDTQPFCKYFSDLANCISQILFIYFFRQAAPPQTLKPFEAFTSPGGQ